MTTNDLYLMIGKAGLGERPSDDDALAFMVLLHTHRLLLGSATLVDRPGASVLAAIAQRHAAEVVAGAWPDRADREHTDRNYWYYWFNTKSPFEVVEDIPPEWISRVENVRSQLTKSGLVAGLEPED